MLAEEIKTKKTQVASIPRIWRDEFGQLYCEWKGKKTLIDLSPCFPWSKPSQYLSVRDVEKSEELFLIKSVDELSESAKAAVEMYLLEKGFYFQVNEIKSVEELFELRHWHVMTHQGERLFQTKLMDWPVVLKTGEICVKDLYGDLYVIESPKHLDKKSQKKLWAFID